MRAARTFIVFCLVASGLVSCSIKTDRTRCFCLLSLSVSGGDEQVMEVHAQSSALSYGGKMSKSGEIATCVFEVEKDSMVVAAYSGIHNLDRAGFCLVAPPGSEMDQLYATSSPVVADDDVIRLDMSLHKQFAFMYLTIVESDGVDYPYYVKVSGEVNGMDISDMSPVYGEYSVLVHPVVGEYHRICLPRQSSREALYLEFYDKDMTRSDDLPLDRLPLGDYIIRSGFDWEAKDLSDVYVDVNVMDMGTDVTVAPWKKVEI